MNSANNLANPDDRVESYYEQHVEDQLRAVSNGDQDTIVIDCARLYDHDAALWDWIAQAFADGAADVFQEVAEDYGKGDFTVEFAEEEEESEKFGESIADALPFPISSDIDDDGEDEDGENKIESVVEDVDEEPEDEPSKIDVPTGVPIEFANLPECARVDIGEPQTNDLGRLVALRGVVRQVSAPKTLTQTARWECQRCGTQHSIPVKIGGMRQPPQCKTCEVKSVPWDRVPRKEGRIDYQEIKLQEEPGDAVDQSNPRTMAVRVEGTELTDVAQPGERVEISGILEEDMSDEMAVIIDSYVQAESIESEADDYDNLDLDEEEIEAYEALSERMDMEELCVESLAPDVFGETMAKRAIVHQLFGGVSHFEESSERTTKAGQIHLAFIGDPGTTKSTLAEAARGVSPRSVKAVGKGMTAAGMTASAVQTEIAGSQEWTLKAGALVLADTGMLTIDELDKANEEVQKSLHEALSDQEVSVSKAGMNVSLPTRVSALLIANPKHGRFDEFEPVVEQFNLDSALLDRADMVLSFVDDPDEDLDAKIARQNLAYAMEGDVSGGSVDDVGALDLTDDGLLTTESYRRYVAYAKREYDPVMTEAARDHLEDFYVYIRSLSTDDDVSLSARAIDSLRKFAEARARMQLRDEISLSDAEAVVEMYMEMYMDMGMDPDTGAFSASRVEGTRGASTREQTRALILSAVRELCDPESGEFASRADVLDAVDSDESVEAVLNNMLRSDALYEPVDGEVALAGGDSQ